MHRLRAIVSFMSTGGGWVAVVSMWLMVLVIFAEILSRTFFDTSLVFTLEVSAWLMIPTTFMVAAWTLKEDSHIRISLISSHLSKHNQYWLTVILAATGVAISGFLAFCACEGLVTNYTMDIRGHSLVRLPLWWAWSFLFVGLFLLTIQFIITLLENIIRVRESTHEGREGLSPVWIIGLGVILFGVVSFLLIWPKAEGMSTWLILLVTFGIVFGLIFSNLWIFLALTLGGISGIAIFTSYPLSQLIAKQYFSSNANFIFTCLPLFIFMGELLFHSGASRHLYSGVATWIEKLPGGLLHSNVLACTLFAAVSGSSAATCATVGSVAVPELKELGYDEGISLGSLAGAGTLGLLIPPSIVMIVYGAVANESVGQLFLGGVIPGLIIATLFMLYIGFVAVRRPSIAPVARSYSWRQKIRGLVELMPTTSVIFLVLGLLYLGITTPTEAAAVGCVCGFVALVAYRKLNWQTIKEASWSAIGINCMMMIIVAGAGLLAATIGYLRVPQQLVAAVAASGMSTYMLLFILCIIYVALGCIFDGVVIILLTLPIVYPLIIALGFNGIWFGILLTILIETGLITPPVGYNLYVLQSISRRDMAFIVRNSMPFFFLLLVGIIILIVFPQLALILPNMMVSGR